MANPQGINQYSGGGKGGRAKKPSRLQAAQASFQTALAKTLATSQAGLAKAKAKGWRTSYNTIHSGK